MKRDEIVIRVMELPPRAMMISEDELEGVFGGCIKEGQVCTRQKECCDPLTPCSPIFIATTGIYWDKKRCFSPLW